MKISHLQIAGLVAALSACASNPPDTAGTPQLAVADVASVPVDEVATPAVPGDDADALVCEQIKVIGKLIPKRVCKTRAQIAQEQVAGRAMTDGMQGPGPNRDPSLPRDTGKFGSMPAGPKH